MTIILRRKLLLFSRVIHLLIDMTRYVSLLWKNEERTSQFEIMYRRKTAMSSIRMQYKFQQAKKKVNSFFFISQETNRIINLNISTVVVRLTSSYGVEEFGITHSVIKTNGISSCYVVLIDGQLDGIPFAYLSHSSRIDEHYDTKSILVNWTVFVVLIIRCI